MKNKENLTQAELESVVHNVNWSEADYNVLCTLVGDTEENIYLKEETHTHMFNRKGKHYGFYSNNHILDMIKENGEENLEFKKSNWLGND